MKYTQIKLSRTSFWIISLNITDLVETDTEEVIAHKIMCLYTTMVNKIFV